MSGRPGRYSSSALHQAGVDLCAADGVQPSLRNIAVRLGVARGTVARWRSGRQGTVNRHRIADRVEQVTGRHISTFEVRP